MTTTKTITNTGATTGELHVIQAHTHKAHRPQLFFVKWKRGKSVWSTRAADALRMDRDEAIAEGVLLASTYRTRTMMAKPESQA